ncbi:hypothetical protein [Streptomyces sp. CAU 1734]|uniref:hypothetical protein n=1 Tax=Streptomyces sp. CAU 1734 TaxID=3140360 RepID=UPI003260FEFE
MEPINVRDPQTAARVYTQTLKWPLTIGHRYRPRAGCTCGESGCPFPGAHPILGASSFPKGVAEAIQNEPGAGLIASTVVFDALVMPRAVCMTAMVRLDAEAPVPVPCLLFGKAAAALLVLPGTGRHALTIRSAAAVDVRTGPEQWVALPPSQGTRWDTPPWADPAGEPVRLLHGSDVKPHLHVACVRTPR